ncbi:MAG: phosphate ABC transporter substrate-binding protein PstS, partial [Lamprocystis purpurea]|nr:phosphate ABC transporter substrate-binding protein PstS [Lamprocystis purpurea]
TDPADPAAYPIVTFTWMLFFREHGNERISAALRDFVTWALADGQGMAADLGYIPMPKAVVERVQAEIPNIR